MARPDGDQRVAANDPPNAVGGPLDFLLIDLPPGTGDVHLSIISEMSITGAIVVSTPQKVALADVVRGIAMFRNDKIDIPVLGLVENMAWFTPAELPENRYYLFGKEGVKMLAERQNCRCWRRFH